MRAGRALVVLGLVVALAAPAAAQPQPTPEDQARARELYVKGDQHFKLAEYDEAIAAFKESYRLWEAPLLLYNLAQAHRLKGDCGLALRFYRNYLRDDPKGAQAAQARLQVPKMEACAAAKGQTEEEKPGPGPENVIVTDPKPPVPEVKPEVRPEVKPEVRPEVKPGEGARVGGEGRRDVGGGGGGHPGRGMRWAGMGVGVVGVVLLGVAGVFSVKASKAEKDVLDLCGSECTWSAELQERQQEGRKAEKTAWFSAGVGVAAVAGGTVLYVLGLRAGRAETRVTLVPGGGSVAWAWSF